MWLRDYHFDGLRLDAVQTIVDTSAMHLLEQLAREVDTLEAHLGRRLVLVAETDRNDPRLVRGEETGGYGLDAQWADDMHHAIHAVLTGDRTAIMPISARWPIWPRPPTILTSMRDDSRPFAIACMAVRRATCRAANSSPSSRITTRLATA